MTLQTGIRFLAWLALVLGAGSFWLGRAQPPAPAGDDPRFTGKSTSLESKDLGLSRRRFEPGARSAWHSHDRGQLLFVEEGRARLQKRGQPLQELAQGDSDFTSPNVVHWHGATPHEAFVQVAVGFGGETRWLEKVTDEEYEGQAVR